MKIEVPPITFLVVSLSAIALVIAYATSYYSSRNYSEPKQLLCSLAGEAYLQLENNQVHRVPNRDEDCPPAAIKETKK